MFGELLKILYVCCTAAIDRYGVVVLHTSAELGRVASTVFLRIGTGFCIEIRAFLAL
jgi:hypothetical protein